MLCWVCTTIVKYLRLSILQSKKKVNVVDSSGDLGWCQHLGDFGEDLVVTSHYGRWHHGGYLCERRDFRLRQEASAIQGSGSLFVIT